MMRPVLQGQLQEPRWTRDKSPNTHNPTAEPCRGSPTSESPLHTTPQETNPPHVHRAYYIRLSVHYEREKVEKVMRQAKSDNHNDTMMQIVETVKILLNQDDAKQPVDFVTPLFQNESIWI